MTKKRSDKTIKLEVKITEKDMFLFMLSHVYGKIKGIITLSFSIICLILFPFSLAWGDRFTSGVLLFGAIIYLVLSPVMLLLQAKRQIMTNKVFKEPILYTISKEGLYIKQLEDSDMFKWEDLSKVKRTPFSYLFYISNEQAFILPNRFLEDDLKNTLIDYTKGR